MASRHGGRGNRGPGGAVVEAALGRAEGDLIAVLEGRFAPDALVIDEGAVEAAQITEDPVIAAELDDAVFLRHDLVEELNGIARMAPERIMVS